MPVFNWEDLGGWFFRVERYFQLPNMFEIEKLTVVVISFEGQALNWYR